MLEVWQRVFDDCAVFYGWAPKTRNLLQLSWNKPYPKSNIVCHVWSEIAQEPPFLLLSTHHQSRPAGCHTHVDRCMPFFLEVGDSSGAPSTRLSNGGFVLASRHLLGLGVAATIATQPYHCGVTNAEHLDHAIACKLTNKPKYRGITTAGMATVCQDIWASAWHRAILRTGFASSAELSYSKFLAHGQCGGAVGLR